LPSEVEGRSKVLFGGWDRDLLQNATQELQFVQPYQDSWGTVWAFPYDSLKVYGESLYHGSFYNMQIDPGYRFISLPPEVFRAISPTINEKLSNVTKSAEPACNYNETSKEGSCGFKSSCYEMQTRLRKGDLKDQYIFSTRIGTEERGLELDLDYEHLLVDYFIVTNETDPDIKCYLAIFASDNTYSYIILGKAILSKYTWVFDSSDTQVVYNDTGHP